MKINVSKGLPSNLNETKNRNLMRVSISFIVKLMYFSLFGSNRVIVWRFTKSYKKVAFRVGKTAENPLKVVVITSYFIEGRKWLFTDMACQTLQIQSQGMGSFFIQVIPELNMWMCRIFSFSHLDYYNEIDDPTIFPVMKIAQTSFTHDIFFSTKNFRNRFYPTEVICFFTIFFTTFINIGISMNIFSGEKSILYLKKIHMFFTFFLHICIGTKENFDFEFISRPKTDVVRLFFLEAKIWLNTIGN